MTAQEPKACTASASGSLLREATIDPTRACQPLGDFRVPTTDD